MSSVYIDGDNEFANINGGDGDNDGREGDGPEPPQTRRASLREQPTLILDSELELEQPPTPIRDGNSGLKQKVEHVLRNLCSGQYGPLLLQFLTLIKMDGLFFLKTQTSHSFLVTPDDALSRYWEVSCNHDVSLLGLSRVSMSDFDWCGSAFTSLLLPVYLPVREQGLYEENCVGMLEIVSNTKETCLQFFKEARVCDLFQKEGLICSDVVSQHLGMQLDVSTQESEDPSNFSVDHTRQFTTKEVFESKAQLVNWARDVGKNNGFVVVTRSSYDDKVYLRCKRNGQTSTMKRNGQTSANKWNCPFAIMGQMSKKNGKWSLKVIRGCHNHLTRTI